MYEGKYWGMTVSQKDFITYAECLWQCYVAENSLKRVRDEREQNMSRYKEKGKSGQYLKPKISPSKRKLPYGYQLTQPSRCGKCRGRHYMNCKTLSMRCDKCNEPAHMIRDFPVRNSPEKTKGRVHTLDAHKTKGNTNLVASNVDTVEAQKVCRDCSVSFNNPNFLIDLICLPLKKIDVILGMDWLYANSKYIGCKEKVIFIPAEETTPNDADGY
ncbi:uncharacterized protein LOC131631413 [Vicia villosa]|uniref:uncharacterized protein LOC131631413 n=1 Tax=Vicia villosa TaxID=3911 RepID=UPI00273C9211|nr:uncharacterized protein LOC131631413 [Vicia villosa]